MGREVERKFLVAGDGWRAKAVGSVGIRQGYLASTGRLSMRVRLRDDGTAFLTIKSAEKELNRAEFEYSIPLGDAEELVRLAGATILEKRRHDVKEGEHRWEVDVFAGRHTGLMIAEVELEDADAQLPLPDWIGREVTGDARYYNEALAKP